MWLIDNHVSRDVPTTWPRSVPRKVAPQLTTTVGWPTAGDQQGRVRDDLSLLLVRSAGPVAQTGWRPPGASWSCGLNAAATSPGDLLRAGACAWWLSCCSALRAPACSPRTSLASRSTHMCYWSTLGYNRRRWQLSGQAPREVMISVHGIMTIGECNELASRCDLGVSRAVGMVWNRYQSLKVVYRQHI